MFQECQKKNLKRKEKGKRKKALRDGQRQTMRKDEIDDDGDEQNVLVGSPQYHFAEQSIYKRASRESLLNDDQ